MIVTDLKYHMDDNLIKKYDIMANRCTGKSKFDNVILVDGDEGYGKTTFAVASAYYLAWKTGRKFDINNVFFDPDKFIKFASQTKEQVIVFDEAVLVGMASNWQDALQKKLIKLLMVARKKRHIYFFNIPKFFRLNEYFVVDRSIALIHVYAKKETQLGRFAYFKKRNKNMLYEEIRRSKKRAYNKYYNFHGTFPNALDKIIDEDVYDAMKDVAIEGVASVSEKLTQKDKFQLKLKYRISQLPKKLGITKTELNNLLGINHSSMLEWSKLREKYPDFVQ